MIATREPTAKFRSCVGPSFRLTARIVCSAQRDQLCADSSHVVISRDLWRSPRSVDVTAVADGDHPDDVLLVLEFIDDAVRPTPG